MVRYRIKPPTMLIWGMKDIYGEPELVEASIAMCDNGQMVRLDNATHWTLADEPEKISSLLLEFLKT